MEKPAFMKKVVPPLSYDELNRQIHIWASDFIVRKCTAGLSIGVRLGKDVLVARGYGWASIEPPVPAIAKTIYRVGSLTKQLTAIAVLQLVETGHLGLDDRVATWLPYTGQWGSQARIKQLLNHTSGIGRTAAGFDAMVIAQRRQGDEQYAAHLLAAQPEFTPGSIWRYNNGGYLLAGCLVERITGSYLNYLSKNVLTPTGLTMTYSVDDTEVKRRITQGYDRTDDGRIVPAEYLNFGTVGASGELCSTVLDLLTLDHAFRKERVLSNTSWRIFAEPTQLPNNMVVDYGLGVFIAALGKYREFAHRGDIPGGSAFKAYYPEIDLTVVVLANTKGAPTSMLGRRIARFVLNIPGPEIASPITEHDRRFLRGSYSDGLQTIRIEEDGIRLIAHTPDGPMLLGRTVTGTLISETNPEIQFVPLSREGDRVTRLRVLGPGLWFDAQRN